MAQELDLQNHDGLLVAFNGAHVVDAQTDEVLFDQAMPADELHRLIDHLRNFDVIPMISLGRDLHVEDSYHCMITLPDGLQRISSSMSAMRAIVKIARSRACMRSWTLIPWTSC